MQLESTAEVMFEANDIAASQIENCSLVKEVIDFLFDPKTGCCKNQELLVNGIVEIVARGNFNQAGRTNNDIWAVAWEKPFYAYIAADVATRAVNHARPYLLNNLPAIQSPAWDIAPDTFHPIGHLATDALLGDGIPTQLIGALVHPCRGKRLWRMRQLALALTMPSSSIVGADNAYTSWLVANGISTSSTTPGWMKKHRNAARLFADPFIDAVDATPGFAYTTACHIAADLGYPVYKMDTWICAMVAALPEVFDELCNHYKVSALSDDLLNPGSNYAREFMLRTLDELADDFTETVPRQLIGKIDLDYGFNRLRVADFVLSHIGMEAESSFGLVDRPFDVLSSKSTLGAGLSARYPKLAAVVQNMHKNRVVPRPEFQDVRAAINSLFPNGAPTLKSGFSLR